jgi:hypothetical protein
VDTCSLGGLTPTVAEVYTIVNFLELCLHLNTQFASQISLNSSISKKKILFFSLVGNYKIEIAHKHMRMLNVNWYTYLSLVVRLNW